MGFAWARVCAELQYHVNLEMLKKGCLQLAFVRSHEYIKFVHYI